jgi:tryptophan synthase alpha chain
MVEGGVDVVEVGLPYSDPLMDGPTIQRAAEAALAGGTTTADVVATVEQVAATGAPTLVMTYWNPVERYGVDAFAAALAKAGGAGVITPDLIPDEADAWLAAVDAVGIDPVFLVAPSSTPERIARVAAATRGFVYAASTMGVTGERSAVSGHARELVERVRAATDLPVCVGLGVSTGAQAAEVASYADGVIVGSAFVRRLLDAPTPDEGVRAVAVLAAELATGIRDASR